MTARQTAVINGLLAENLGKNDLIRNAENRSRDANSKANEAELEADALRSKTGGLVSRIQFLERKLQQAEQQEAFAKKSAEQYKEEAELYKSLLSKPMQDIAEVNGDFKETYNVQQQVLAEWILAQRAYKETATALGIELGKTPEEIQKIAVKNANAALENKTEHGNDANTNPVLANHAAAILAIRKKNGKA